MKIFTATPKPFLSATVKDWEFFSRDLGSTCHQLRKVGVESQIVLLDGPNAKQHPDVIRASISEMTDSGWWGKYNLDGVVLGAWADPSYTPIAKAIKDAGIKLILRCDSGGVYSQWQQSLWRTLVINHLTYRCRGMGKFISIVPMIVKTMVFYIPSVYTLKVIEHMSYADLIMNESPEGVRHLKSLLMKYNYNGIAANVQYVPHPVSESMHYNSSVEKLPRIIAVGRWDSIIKNAPMLVKAIALALKDFPKYEAHIFGSGGELIERLLEKESSYIRARIKIRGKLPNEELAKEYQQSRIFFAPSYRETFNIAAAEALSCGCSMAGSGHIFSFRHFISKNCGTVARRYTSSGMADALKTEMIAWERGIHSPEEISRIWRDEARASRIAGLIVRTVETPHRD